MRKTTVRSLMWLLVAAWSAILVGCAKPDQQPAATAAPPPATQPQPTAAKPLEKATTVPDPPPSLGEVKSALTRVYEGAVTADPNRFLAGDFDGDGAQDLAAVVRPVKGKLPEINSELARWKLEDPRKIIIPSLRKALQGVPPLPVLTPTRADSDDLLLVVIQGHGASGWRSPEAMSSYLLKNAVGSGMSRQTLKEAREATKGKGRPFILKGEVIKQTLAGEKGFLFWSGSGYAWHSLESKRARS